MAVSLKTKIVIIISRKQSFFHNILKLWKQQTYV